MTVFDRLRHRLLRWSRLWLAAVLAVPFLITSGLGFVWLYDQGWLIWFIVGTTGFYAVVQIALALSRRFSPPVDANDLSGPAPEADWSPRERAAYDKARVRIEHSIATLRPWSDLPSEGLAIVESVAADLSDGRRGMLDFTMPEALLLTERVALRYRAFLLSNVPYSDRLSVRSLYWIWQKQETALTAWEGGSLLWRGVRFVLNPTVGVLREAERALATSLQGRLTERFQREAQVVLLEEIAQAAIDLYSGRLRFTDAELARFDAADPPPVQPLRMVVIGQSGVGKSALVNALMGQDAHETGLVTPSQMDQTSEWRLSEGGALRVVDTGGFDGSKRRQDAVLAQISGADLVVWVHRADRPARASDAAVLARWTDTQAQDADFRAPPILHVVTGIDRVLSDWPRPENHVTPADRMQIDAVTQAVSGAVGGAPVLAVSLQPSEWNIAAVREAVIAAQPEARRAQRSRLRRAAEKGAGLTQNAKRAGRGMGKLVGRFLPQITRH